MELMGKIEHGWDVSAEGYSQIVAPDDLSSPGKEVWTDLILERSPKKTGMDVLDIGTGPGVFATLMAMAGNRVTATDISEEMLVQAAKNSESRGVSVDYIKMDVQKLPFPDESFDLIISRNVIWALPDPKGTLSECKRVLRKGGALIYFDGGHPQRDYTYREDRRAYQEAYEKKFGEKFPTSFENYEEARGWKHELPLTYAARPEWDIRALKDLGFSELCYIDCASRAAINPKQLFKLNYEQFFRISALK